MQYPRSSGVQERSSRRNKSPCHGQEASTTSLGQRGQDGFDAPTIAYSSPGSASQIARTMARKDVSPKGLGSAIRMVQYFINRGGRRLSASRRRELERAKRILQQRRQSTR